MSAVAETTAKSEPETTDTQPNNNLTPNSKSEIVQSAEATDTNVFHHNGQEDQKNPTLNSTDKEIVNETEMSILEVGSPVANNDPDKMSYNWHGTIVGFSQGGADVCWDERKGIQGGQVLWHHLTELRLL
jgi:hypothetical protein